jgi:hypothetical protein
MKKKGNLYEYIAVNVDDLAISMKDPKELTDILAKQHKFKLKRTGPISFHLAMDFTRDDDNTLCISPAKCIDKLVKNYIYKPRSYTRSKYDIIQKNSMTSYNFFRQNV